MNQFVIRKPVITEKTLQRANLENIYTFEVARTADKNKIKAAVEEMYSVNVIDINTVMRPKKSRRTGQKRVVTFSAKTKKALVKLKSGQSISVFDVGGDK
ncbi:MAG: 50S ribosomal protein L23 [Candidatus Pacebacteria bacterium CG10_big_fil_rev_8_21_14_0_10_36_11]|nr:50S ribosomal protein L23 [Candidatus Pacearchaeota archaeon]OIP73701.1 MAG: 50S ribosomal protein L23 [Candidatus Pacebacteria bacterium CG2_30_36_39]PIR64714.1 MAG: 50S ribosomal protein L23 [Candidatus Pacebacteria bacterium CG10_big_fil_rev_8_21_14_0_10_36_11]PJC42337.1 MAG: 50S ribosomal protein L23 [Candidatus Pacebacteria bacterium CG_4_9_14_0_2_um_filter_36_8]